MNYWVAGGLGLAGAAALILGLRTMRRLVDSGFLHWQRLAEDADYRREQLEKLDRKVERFGDNPGRCPAAILMNRANIRRLDANRQGAREDLALYLQKKPNDDAGWQELAEDCLLLGDFGGAKNAIEEACRLDPQYVDYPRFGARVAIAMNDATFLKSMLERWQNLASRLPDDRRQDDPCLQVCSSALSVLIGQKSPQQARNEIPESDWLCALDEFPEIADLFA